MSKPSRRPGREARKRGGGGTENMPFGRAWRKVAFGALIGSLLLLLVKPMIAYVLIWIFGSWWACDWLAEESIGGFKIGTSRLLLRCVSMSLITVACGAGVFWEVDKANEEAQEKAENRERLERLELAQQQESQRSAARDEEILREIRAMRGIEAPKLLPIDTNSAVTYIYGNLSASLTLLSTDNGQWVYRINYVESPNIHERGSTATFTLSEGTQVGIVNADDKSLRASVLVATTGEQVPWMGVGPRIERGSGVTVYTIQGRRLGG